MVVAVVGDDVEDGAADELGDVARVAGDPAGEADDVVVAAVLVELRVGLEQARSGCHVHSLRLACAGDPVESAHAQVAGSRRAGDETVLAHRDAHRGGHLQVGGFDGRQGGAVAVGVELHQPRGGSVGH